MHCDLLLPDQCDGLLRPAQHGRLEPGQAEDAALFPRLLVLHQLHPDGIVGKVCEAARVLADGVGEARIAADLSKEVVLRLAVAGEVEDAGEGVEVYDKVDRLLWQVSLHAVDDGGLIVNDLDVRVVLLVHAVVHVHVILSPLLGILHRAFSGVTPSY